MSQRASWSCVVMGGVILLAACGQGAPSEAPPALADAGSAATPAPKVPPFVAPKPLDHVLVTTARPEPEAAANAPAIIVAGRRLPAYTSLKLVTFDDPGGLSFPAAAAKEPRADFLMKRPIDRVNKEYITTLAQLRAKVTQIVIGTDFADDSATAFKRMVARGMVAAHFFIDWDGTVYQAADVIDQAHFAGEADPYSVSIVLNNLWPDLKKNPKADLWPKHHPRRAEMGVGFFERKIREGRLHHVDAVGPTYTVAQEQALESLVATLRGALPAIRVRVPGKRGKEHKAVWLADDAPDIATYGIVGLQQLLPDGMAPGPGFYWHGMANRGWPYLHMPVHFASGQDEEFDTANRAEEAEASAVTAQKALEGRIAAHGAFGASTDPAAPKLWNPGLTLWADTPPEDKATPTPDDPRALLGGVVVAAYVPPLGPAGGAGKPATGFVVVRHAIDLPRKAPEPFVFYTRTTGIVHPSEAAATTWPIWSEQATPEARAALEAGKVAVWSPEAGPLVVAGDKLGTVMATTTVEVFATIK